MYVPIMKNRTQEANVVRDFQKHLDDKIIPLFEIITDYYEDRFQVDPESGKYVMILPEGKKKRTKVKLPRREEDLITLSELNKILNGKKAFIDFFRFIEKEYKGIKVDSKKVELSFSLSRDYKSYKERMLELGRFNNFIPTISIKEGFEFSTADLISLITELRIENAAIAIRITDDLLEKYSDIISEYCFEKDFIMLDIREQNIEAKFMELEEFEELETYAKKILLNSPRLKNKKNSDYEELTFTNKIDNSCATDYIEYNLDGFGDFGGLKDTLPSQGGGGKGSALALMYSIENNQFLSLVNKDSNLGLSGYKDVVNELLVNRSLIDINYDCPVLNTIEEKSEKGSYGNWQSWTYYILGRYIHQQATK